MMCNNLRTLFAILFLYMSISPLPVAYGREKLLYGSAKGRPTWITKPPLPDKNYIYFVGIKTNAESIEAGREEAVKNVANQIVEYIGIKVSVKLISQKSELITKLSDEIRLYAKANIRGAIIKEMYYERNKKEKTYNVYILTRYSKNEIEKERKRIQELLQDYNRKIGKLAAEILIKLRNENIRQVLIGGFKELVSQRRYSFSNILENDLKTKIVAGGIGIIEDPQAAYLLTGTYRAQVNDVVISVNIINRKTKANIFAKYLSISKDVLEPGWLKIEKPEETFFSELKGEPQEKGRSGTLSITSDPIGARIFLDGDYRGKTNVDIRQVPLGPHNVTMIKDKYKVYVKTVDIYEDRTSTVDIKLEPKRGSLSIKTNPKEAKIFINEKYCGLTPRIISGLLTGEYDLSLKKEKHKDYNEKIEIIFEGTIEKTINLVEEDGSLLVISTPINAKVYLDSEYKGLAAPLFLEKVSSGKHIAKVEMEGYKPWEKPVVIRAFKAQTISANLKRLRTGAVKIYSVPSDAIVYMDGIEKGSTPITIEDVPAGKHRIQIMKENYQSWTGTVMVTAGETITILKQLKLQND